jgi:hypothetical protein
MTQVNEERGRIASDREICQVLIAIAVAPETSLSVRKSAVAELRRLVKARRPEPAEILRSLLEEIGE